ncbi:MAG: hypothetical protein VB074_05250 [Proteiniphilum sp.]|uniref:hypothetical protein n=1 Tax=Proteiniphilum sp. TaxID=1926877 RepID=UPI002B2014ED|nr:hypothetical protein [Proteiniphilum sp.]MEA5127569.1 hypothetical protein [Proteiniphilum sp.]
MSVTFTGVLMDALCPGCDESEHFKAVDIPFTMYPSEEASFEWTNLGDVYTKEGKVLVINSDEELSNYVEGDYPAIDFSKKTLVLAYGYWSGAPLTSDGYKFQQISDRNYVVSANFISTALAVMVDWQVAMVVDKLPSDSTIKFNVVIVN